MGQKLLEHPEATELSDKLISVFLGLLSPSLRSGCVFDERVFYTHLVTPYFVLPMKFTTGISEQAIPRWPSDLIGKAGTL